MAFSLPSLPFAPDALEPAIDAKTMDIHYNKHHGGYAGKLTAALEGTPWADKDIVDILTHLEDVPADKQTAVRNNGGGYYNHSLFWSILKPGGSEPSGAIADALEADLGGFSEFKKQFSNAAATRFGSGWAWLGVGAAGKLHISSTANQDTPIMPESFGGHGKGHTPVLGLDVWEHAYYLNYQNRRPDYIEAFFGIINWDEVNRRYQAAKG